MSPYLTKSGGPRLRTRQTLGLVALAVAATVAGCADSRAPDERLIRDLVHRLENDQQQRLTDAVPNERDGSESANSQAVPAESGPEQYVRMALERSPRIASAEARVRRLVARVPQERSLEDPMLMVTPFGQMAETAAGEVGLMAGVSQRLPLPQKLSARAGMAEQETAAALAELAGLRQEVAAEVRRAYWTYWLADRQIEVVRQSRDLLATLRDAAEVQLRGGRATQGDLLRASTELANLENELVDLEQDLEVAIAALNRLLDRPVTAPLPDPPEAAPTQLEESLEALLDEASARNPRLAAMVEEIGAARSRLRVARLDYWPDLTVEATYTVVEEEGLSPVANGEDQWTLGFGINVPIWTGRRRAAVREANAAVREGVSRLRAEENEVAFAVRSAVAELDARRRLVTLFEETVLPQARQTVEATAAGYRADSAAFLDYVEAWRRLLEFELAQRQAVADLGRAVADLERALGREPVSLRPGTPPMVPSTAPSTAPGSGNSPTKPTDSNGGTR